MFSEHVMQAIVTFLQRGLIDKSGDDALLVVEDFPEGVRLMGYRREKALPELIEAGMSIEYQEMLSKKAPPGFFWLVFVAEDRSVVVDLVTRKQIGVN